MTTHRFKPDRLQLILALIVSFFLAGCATQPSSRSGPSFQLFDIEGTWSWDQGPYPYHGEFTLKKDGDSYSGTLDDVHEGTYGDKIADVEVSGDHIKLTRYGGFGIQYWEGTLAEEDGILKITDGQWSKGPGVSGAFYAEKKE